MTPNTCWKAWIHQLSDVGAPLSQVRDRVVPTLGARDTEAWFQEVRDKAARIQGPEDKEAWSLEPQDMAA